MGQLLEAGQHFPGKLLWLADDGVGYLPPSPQDVVSYDDAYFETYEKLADTDLGVQLTERRISLVTRWAGPGKRLTRLDVGIGSGQFIDRMDRRGYRCHGYDVNPAGVAWLMGRGSWGMPREGWDVMTFWDSLEHIPDPREPLRHCREWAFVALPTFAGAEHIRRSKHLKPGEHLWYFTRAGFCRFAASQGFEVVDITATETAMGREDIETFVLRRRGDPARLCRGEP